MKFREFAARMVPDTNHNQREHPRNFELGDDSNRQFLPRACPNTFDGIRARCIVLKGHLSFQVQRRDGYGAEKEDSARMATLPSVDKILILKERLEN